MRGAARRRVRSPPASRAWCGTAAVRRRSARSCNSSAPISPSPLELFTDEHGRYRIASILPGVYEVKASADSSCPPCAKICGSSGERRWSSISPLIPSTKRSAGCRPSPARRMSRKMTGPGRCDSPRIGRCCACCRMARWLWSANGDGSAPELKARVTVRGGESGFGDGGVHNDFEMERAPDDGRAMIFRADLSQAEDPALNAMAGYEQQLAPGRTFRTVAAIETGPISPAAPPARGCRPSPCAAARP